MSQFSFKSKQQILASQISKFLSETGINDINAGSGLLTLLEANSREAAQQYVQMTNIIRNYNLDSTTGSDLDNRGFEFGLTRYTAKKTTGVISILRASTFEKVAASLYSGLPAPIGGDSTLNLNDASNALFGTSGTLIIGRDTINEEEVTYSVAPVDNTNYWTVTLDAPMVNDHGLEETVILKQGDDEDIQAGTVITVQATPNSPAVTFVTNQDTTLPSGEASISNVGVTCTAYGEVGNISVLAISGEAAFSSAPFAGARAENDSKFTTGRNRESDDEFRDRIKNHIQSLSRGIKAAIKNALIGLVDPETAKRIVSANVVLPTTTTDHVKIYLDDSLGFEPSFEAKGFESILETATGGELRFQLDNFPLVKAQVEAAASEPYDMSSGALTLSYEAAGEAETITFNTTNFEFSNVATAEEIVKAVNNAATLIEARTTSSGKGFVLTPKTDTNESIQVTGGTANSIFGLPTDKRETFYLYKNDQKLSKDGATASIETTSAETYNFNSLGASPWPLNIIVDGKSANPQVVSFVTGDFVDAAAATAEEVVTAINARLAGATASVFESSTKVRISSNKELTTSSKLQVTGGSANTVLNFPTAEVVGSDKDYTLNRFTGTIELESSLVADDNLTTGSQHTRAYLRAASAQPYNITAAQTLVVSIDGAANKTITFPTTGSYDADSLADLINARISGMTAASRLIGDSYYLEITTNTYAETGSLEVKSTSTATALDFELDSEVSSQRPHKAYVESAAEDFELTQGQNLVIVVDDDVANKTFSIPMDQESSVTTGTSTTIFRDSTLSNKFGTDDELVDFAVVFTSGANTVAGTVSTITDQGGGTFRYAFSSLPANLTDIAAGDQATFSGAQNLENDGIFKITARSTAGNGYVEVSNSSGIAESGSTITTELGQRRDVINYTSSNGELELASAVRATPSIGNTYTLIPVTAANVVQYLNNTKITALSNITVVETSTNGTKVEISSDSEGSSGYIQVTGGTANSELGFSTSKVRGLQGYNYYTGLLAIANDTIYGSDRDPESYPGVGAAGIDFEIISPTVEEISIALNLTLAQGLTLSIMEDEIKSAVTGYVNNLGINEDVILAEIVNAVMNIDGVVDVEVVTPTANVVIGDSELPRTRRSLIVLG